MFCAESESENVLGLQYLQQYTDTKWWEGWNAPQLCNYPTTGSKTCGETSGKQTKLTKRKWQQIIWESFLKVRLVISHNFSNTKSSNNKKMRGLLNTNYQTSWAKFEPIWCWLQMEITTVHFNVLAYVTQHTPQETNKNSRRRTQARTQYVPNKNREH